MLQRTHRIDPRLVRLIERADPDEAPIAAIWRRVGRRAGGLGVVRPSYETVRRIVHATRERAREEFEVVFSVAIRLAVRRPKRRPRRRPFLSLRRELVRSREPGAARRVRR